MQEKQTQSSETASKKRKNMFSILFCIIAVIGLGTSAYWYFVSSHYVSTNNAYVAAEVAQVTPSVDGIVQVVTVVDTQCVKAGDVLVTIDDIDAKLALARASGVLAKARTDVERTEIDLKRRKALAASGSISGEELSTAENMYNVAKAGFDMAKADAEQAEINLSRTVVKAPIDGIVAKREVQLGQKVRSGTPLMSIVPVANVYINANFKENQLDKVKPGQPVELQSDLYGSRVVYHGRVAGVSGGTGSVFSLIPAQNATGNWIKVVQRLPVRVTLDAQELLKNPLQVGLSMSVTIDTHTQTL